MLINVRRVPRNVGRALTGPDWVGSRHRPEERSAENQTALTCQNHRQSKVLIDGRRAKMPIKRAVPGEGQKIEILRGTQ
jgi:hypothetical protein